jgi:3-methyladenine DNA glycosylase AlkC
LVTAGLEERSILQRLRQGTLALRATLPADYLPALGVLRRLAPLIDHSFVGLMLPEFVGRYGHDHFEASMDAIREFTRYSSGEFAIREFLIRDKERTLAVMEEWSRDEDEHVRRLACEGCRPRLPWSFRLPALIADPRPVAPILDNLRADPSLYVRKSVANHLNDISKDHPEWMLARIRSWDLDNARTAWIAKRAARSLIKSGDPRALLLFGFRPAAAVRVEGLRVRPTRVQIGGEIEFSFGLQCTGRQPQQLVVDYAVHYMKASGRLTPKVFKLREVELHPGEGKLFARRHALRDLTTRKHHAGRHRLAIHVNGAALASVPFTLLK